MACGCAKRMRNILRLAKYELEEDGVWRKNGGPEFPDDRVEEHHFKVLIETLQSEVFKGKADNFMNRINRA